MSADRVDKGWQKTGLGAYSTSAILATLAHYGLRVDEPGYKAISEGRYPLQVAHDWHQSWKGKGQFAKFPYAAALELFKRTWPDRPSPMQVTEALAQLLTAVIQKLEGKRDDTAEAFAKMRELRPKLPTSNEELEHLMDEVVIQLGEGGSRAFDELAERLAKAGHLPEAKEFAQLEEALVPDRRGVASSLVRAVAGEQDEAKRELSAVLKDGQRSEETRVMALDALIHLEAHPEATTAAEAMLAHAEKGEDFHVGLAVCERLGYLYEKQQLWTELEALAARAKALANAHGRAHPHHRH